MPNQKQKQTKRVRSWSILGIKVQFYKSRGPGDQECFWTIKLNKLDLELVRRRIFSLLDGDTRDCWETKKLAHIRTSFTNLNNLLKSLKRTTLPDG